MRGPSDYELGDSRKSIRRGRVKECLLGEQIRATRARIQFREFRVRQRGGVREAQCDENARPHRDRRRIGLVRLREERDPKECSWRDQRHRVHGHSREPERRFHLWRFLLSHLSSLAVDYFRDENFPPGTAWSRALAQEECHETATNMRCVLNDCNISKCAEHRQPPICRASSLDRLEVVPFVERVETLIR